ENTHIEFAGWHVLWNTGVRERSCVRFTLPILNPVEIANDWNQVGRSFPTIAGDAFILWVRYRYSIRTCIYWASRKRKKSAEYNVCDECDDETQARMLATVDASDACERVRRIVLTQFAEGTN